MNKFKSHFKFDKQERSGIFFLLLLIVLFQMIHYYCSLFYNPSNDSVFSLDEEQQIVVDSLKREKQNKNNYKVFPFNPNYITDYKGYQLGMSIQEIDRLHSFRKENKFINSKQDFQKVTQVSDSLLDIISPYFKFPSWITDKKPYKSNVGNKAKLNTANKIVVKQDLNTVTTEELKKINGIGEKLAARIIKYRNKLGGFLTEKQLYEVYYLEKDVAQRVLANYKIITAPTIKKIDINKSSAYEISQLIYLNYNLSKKIVEYRELNNGINSFDDLLNIEEFPSEKIDIISLYLQL